MTKRINYLYPDQTSPAALAHYLDEFSAILALARKVGVKVLVIKMPVPPRFYMQLPEEAGFDAAMARVLAAPGVPFHDFSETTNDQSLYFDTDHLNRAGLTAFVEKSLMPLLLARAAR